MPSPTLVATADAAPLRRRQRRPFESVTLPLSVFHSLVLPSRDWAGLPPELLSSILQKLDDVQIMLGADKVCRSWRRAARDEPELWRHIDMPAYKALSNRNLINLNQMAVEAVRRSQGQCQAFSGEGDLYDGFIHYLGNHAPLLKHLNLVSCGGLSGQGFVQAIKGFPLLEELHLCNCWRVQHAEVFEVIAKECPRLKHLTVRHAGSPIHYGYDDTEDKEAMAIASMHELRSLQLINNRLSIQGLEAIFDNCIHLEWLELIKCYNIHMTPEMEARIKTKGQLMSGYRSDGRFDDFESGCLIGHFNSECSTCLSYFTSYSQLRYEPFYPGDVKEEMVISVVRKLRSLELYRNQLTSKGLADILDICPHLVEPLDVWNCINIIRNSHNALQGKWPWHRIKTKKVTTKLLMNRYKHTVFNPEGLDIRNCRNIVMNTYRGHGIMNNLGGKYRRLKLRKMAKSYHERTKAMKARIEEYIAKLPGGNVVDYMEFAGMDLDYGVLDHPNSFKPCSPIAECSSCLMFEYFAERWGFMDLDDYADYYDPSYGLDRHDETEFQVHDRMLGKKFRRYLKME